MKSKPGLYAIFATGFMVTIGSVAASLSWSLILLASGVYLAGWTFGYIAAQKALLDHLGITKGEIYGEEIDGRNQG